MKTPITLLLFLLFSQFSYAQLFYNIEVPKTEKEKVEIAKKEKQKQAQKEKEEKLKREQALAIQRKNEERAREQARIEAEERAERERLAEIERRNKELSQRKYEEGKIALKKGNYELASILFKESFQANSEIGNQGRELLKFKIKQVIEIDKNDCELINLLISYTEIIKNENNDLLTLKCKK